MEVDLDELALLGAAVIMAQKIEFALYGVAAHASHTPAAAKDRRFRNLTPEAFLRGDPAELKATLGQLVATFGDLFAISTADLNRYVDDRNLISHSYWRLTRAKIRGAQQLAEPVAFLRDFLKRSDELVDVLNGFVAHLMIAVGEKEIREVTLSAKQRYDMDAYLRHVAKHLGEQT